MQRTTLAMRETFDGLATRWHKRGYSLGFGYKDECTSFNLKYSSSLSAPAAYPLYAGGPVIYNPAVRNQTLMFQLVLRTLGDLKGNVGL